MKIYQQYDIIKNILDFDYDETYYNLDPTITQYTIITNEICNT